MTDMRVGSPDLVYGRHHRAAVGGAEHDVVVELGVVLRGDRVVDAAAVVIQIVLGHEVGVGSVHVGGEVQAVYAEVAEVVCADLVDGHVDRIAAGGGERSVDVDVAADVDRGRA